MGAFTPLVSASPYNAQTGTTYTLVDADANRVVSMNNASANTVTVPAGLSIEEGIGIIVLQIGAGATTITPAVGVNINGANSSVVVPYRYKAVTLLCIGADAYVALGV